MKHLPVIVMGLLMSPAGLLFAGGPPSTCGHCGCCLRKVVRMECTTKDVVEQCYDCECEDFALLGPSKKCHVPCSCPDGCCKGGCGHHDHVVWKPGHCGKPRTRHVLVKYEKVKKVPTYKCVVEYVCDRCGCGCSCLEGEPLPADTIPSDDLPPMPPPPTASQGSGNLPVQPISAERSAGFSWKTIFGR